MTRKLYTSSQVVESIPNLTYRQLDYWIRKELYTPYVKGNGSGTRHQFDEFDVLVVRVMACCMRVGVPDNGIRAGIRAICQEFDEAPKKYARWLLIFDGDNYVSELAPNLPGLVETLGCYPDKAAWIIPLAPLREATINAERTLSSGHS